MSVHLLAVSFSTNQMNPSKQVDQSENYGSDFVLFGVCLYLSLTGTGGEPWNIGSTPCDTVVVVQGMRFDGPGVDQRGNFRGDNSVECLFPPFFLFLFFVISVCSALIQTSLITQLFFTWTTWGLHMYSNIKRFQLWDPFTDSKASWSMTWLLRKHSWIMTMKYFELHQNVFREWVCWEIPKFQVLALVQLVFCASCEPAAPSLCVCVGGARGARPIWKCEI